jgi:hypothetical protein
MGYPGVRLGEINGRLETRSCTWIGDDLIDVNWGMRWPKGKMTSIGRPSLPGGRRRTPSANTRVPCRTWNRTCNTAINSHGDFVDT